MTERCDQCKWYRVDERDNYKDHGECWRFPPVLAMQRANSEFGNPQDDWNSARPRMKGDEFCGDYTPRA